MQKRPITREPVDLGARVAEARARVARVRENLLSPASPQRIASSVDELVAASAEMAEMANRMSTAEPSTGDPKRLRLALTELAAEICGVQVLLTSAAGLLDGIEQARAQTENPACYSAQGSVSVAVKKRTGPTEARIVYG